MQVSALQPAASATQLPTLELEYVQMVADQVNVTYKQPRPP